MEKVLVVSDLEGISTISSLSDSTNYIQYAEEINIVSSKVRNQGYEVYICAGQKQRIAICRALISEKNIVLLDEPLSNLDSGKSKTVEKQIIELAKEKIVVVATHEGFKDGISLPIFSN